MCWYSLTVLLLSHGWSPWITKESLGHKYSDFYSKWHFKKIGREVKNYGINFVLWTPPIEGVLVSDTHGSLLYRHM